MLMNNPKQTCIEFINGEWKLSGESAHLWKQTKEGNNPLYNHWTLYLKDLRTVTLAVAYAPYGEFNTDPHTPGSLHLHWKIGFGPGNNSNVHLTFSDCGTAAGSVPYAQEFLKCLPTWLVPQNNEVVS